MTRTFTAPKDAPKGHEWQTRNGREVVVYEQITMDPANCFETIFGRYKTSSNGVWHPMSWTDEGQFNRGGGNHPMDLCDKPRKQTLWVNIYPETSAQRCAGCNSRAEADRFAATTRIACVRIEYEEGQYDV